VKKVLALLLLAVAANAVAYVSCAEFDNTGKPIAAQQWRVGQTDWQPIGSFPMLDDVDDPSAIITCYANGQEYAYIRQNVTGLRYYKQATDAYWTAEDAQFVLNNIP
jgi:hypothetical protein